MGLSQLLKVFSLERISSFMQTSRAFVPTQKKRVECMKSVSRYLAHISTSAVHRRNQLLIQKLADGGGGEAIDNVNKKTDMSKKTMTNNSSGGERERRMEW